MIAGVSCLIGFAIVLGSGTLQPVQAETRQVNLTLTSGGYANFADLRQQAEAMAADSIQQFFLQNPAADEVSVKITGEHNGTEVPLLFLTVSRSNWKQTPSIQAWARYFSSSEKLLGFIKPQPVGLSIALIDTQYRQALKEQAAYRDD
ncbi:hypothetical protein BST81_13995 [Leptolyngbya sp. 'hensonii']|nr:hypothetical protein BST81_13995 [Leptolyngbya sp. 'hensonii']